ncbi:MAG: phenylalanine--tRNA ligase subunit beta [Buchnera aphidicola (Periphyllus lyropictus)]|uniref:phenylalanine--tRNA ligase subunit beta n=1 Tax=Buchnera aphidicola TaxID=9 RepID=UPI001ED6BF0E|nr:phenylalanine--tRNA ligase subunit beta [Buchnera aphidicola]NIH16707.1 phenylalanine--tRNA ligase subunit beta [Buchnera aphidicola (Periphyllus lyropictus)]USS94613.1 phenylalanine--tRNA ligase subunit beta [Buchnera aphidicola (Periphyllus lyropictus)]
MKFSLSWVKFFLNKNLKDSYIKNQLTQIGLEVEFLEKNKIFFKNSVIGEIVKILFFNNKKNIRILKINIKSNFFIYVLSNNKNCYIGMKLAVKLKKNREFKFKKKKYFLPKKYLFSGKIYTYFDLKIFGNKNNIVEFPKIEKNGESVKQYFKKNPEDIISLGINSNRNDCLGILGIAREVSVINNIPLNFNINSLEIIKNRKENKDLKIFFLNNKICSEYFSRIIKNIDISVNTPFWIRERLRKSNIKSINIVSDIVNFVSLELGQSIHVFDFEKIVNKKIEIRLSDLNENIRLNNKNNLNLSKDILVFSNEMKIFSLGGFIHSEKFLINKDTKNIYLGCGVFPSFFINRIKKKYDKYYNSYDNYYRKCESKLCFFALEKISKLLIELCGGKLEFLDNFNNLKKTKNKKFVLSYNKINKTLGFSINKFKIIDFLKRLEYVILGSLLKLSIIPPYFRSDILCQEDVISDIVRFYGYNKIPLISLKINSIISNKNNISDNLFLLKNLFLMLGYSEVLNYSFSEKLFQNFFFKNRKILKIINPISKDFSFMRKSLFPGLLKNLKYNKNRQQDSFRLFESGLCFIKKNNSKFSVKQKLFLSGIVSGFKSKKNWLNKDKFFNFYHVKNDLEIILSRFYNFKEIFFKKSNIFGFDDNVCSNIYCRDIKIGHLGMINSNILIPLNIKNDVFGFEISIKKLYNFKNYKINEKNFYPYSERDISIIIKEEISISDILYECYKISKDNILKIIILDIYRGKNIPLNKKSLSIRFFFKNEKKNFTNEEIKILFYNCINKLKSKFHAILRDK